MHICYHKANSIIFLVPTFSVLTLNDDLNRRKEEESSKNKFDENKMHKTPDLWILSIRLLKVRIA